MHSLPGSVINRNVSVSEKVGLKLSNVNRKKEVYVESILDPIKA